MLKPLARVKRRSVRIIRVFRSPLDRCRGRVVARGLDLACTLGRGGTRRSKREGDGATPVGRFIVLGGYYRHDRVRRPPNRVGLVAARPDLGWCDDPRDRRYNRPISLPDHARHETLWREDGVYDVVLDLSYNRAPPVPGRGSAIFLHLMRPDGGPTEGCIAVERRSMRRLLERLGPRTIIEVGPTSSRRVNALPN